MNGLSVNILIPAEGYDCTNHGVTGAAEREDYRVYVLFDEALERGNYSLEECKNDPTICCLKVVRRWVGTPEEYLHVEPMFQRRENAAGPMAGGNYVMSSDSRFRDAFPYPLPVHDRWESWEDYDRMSR